MNGNTHISFKAKKTQTNKNLLKLTFFMFVALTLLLHTWGRRQGQPPSGRNGYFQTGVRYFERYLLSYFVIEC